METIKFLKEKYTRTFEDLTILAECKKHLSKIRLKENNAEQAIKLLEEASIIEQEKIVFQKDIEVNRLTSSIDLAQKKAEVSELTEETLKKQLQIENERKKTFLLIASLIIALLIVFFLYRGYRNKKKNSEKLKKRNDIIEHQKNELEKNLLEKNLLIKEIHHRVKNNFQMVISLLYLQVNGDNVTDVNQFLEEATSRILSMALIHESLYNTENLNEINFNVYVEELIASMIAAYHNKQNTLSFDTHIPEYTFDIQKAIPLGLILNEMILNTVKHVQPQQPDTIINIRLSSPDNHEFILEYYDNGTVPANTKKRKGSFGSELISLLVQQINGKLEISYPGNIFYRITYYID
ncbi:hypothetical protein CHU92_00295 [Flavobacterium cyanobacteriorum]|uniref:histidine kinase n=1 Tax=Flavobacterium cyanobacteriorum TaxID=2022802 RepID=A0A256A7H9_9FLAO|nr:sensor histidine kinase [Flavobacterium cyanobacteriorum]OYQ49687.1 hypothetical protein CHU92_00295 [Flavobacterium cyanobacteriorum]